MASTGLPGQPAKAATRGRLREGGAAAAEARVSRGSLLHRTRPTFRRGAIGGTPHGRGRGSQMLPEARTGPVTETAGCGHFSGGA